MAYSSVDRSLTSECGQWQRVFEPDLGSAHRGGLVAVSRRNKLFIVPQRGRVVTVLEKLAMARTPLSTRETRALSNHVLCC